MDLSIKKGLDLPLSGKPSGPVRTLPAPSQIALNLSPFEDLRFKILVKTEDRVQKGQPLLENKGTPGQFFVSPASGVVKDIRRGLKRRLIDIVIDVAENEQDFPRDGIDIEKATQDEIFAYLMQSGAFAHIRMRPFNLVATPKFRPRSIFVKAIESAPFTPPSEMQIEGQEEYFQAGLDVLKKLTAGEVHLVYKKGSTCTAVTKATRVEKHSIEGPHPSGNSSVHIHMIDPIQNAHDIVWTLSAADVVVIGKLVRTGKYYTDRVISIAGNGILEEAQGYFKGRAGFPISLLSASKIPNSPLCLISGDPTCGSKISENDFLEFNHTVFCAIPQNTHREPLHFLSLGIKKYSATRTYLSGHIPPPASGYDFTTNQHGEKRAFIDGAVYDKVMPLRIPTMHLVKALMAEDFELAENLGLLEIASEDFALPTFICPSKIEMMEIVKEGLHRYSKEMGY